MLLIPGQLLEMAHNFVLYLFVVQPTGLAYHQPLKADVIEQAAQCGEEPVGFVHRVTYRLHRGEPGSDVVPPYHRVEWNVSGLAPVIKAFGEGQPEQAMHYQVSVYLMRFTLIEMVKEPAVGVNEEFMLCSCPGNLGATGTGGVLGILRHTVAEDSYQVRVLTQVGVFTSQDTHKSTKTTLAINKNTFRSLALARRFRLLVTIMPGEGCALSPRQNVATSVFYACACMHFHLAPGYSHPILSLF